MSELSTGLVLSPDTGPLEKLYLFIYFLLMISDEDFYGGRTGPLEKFN